MLRMRRISTALALLTRCRRPSRPAFNCPKRYWLMSVCRDRDLLIIARARDAAHAAHLYRIGASDAVPETIEASLQLSEAVLVDVGVPRSGLADHRARS